MNQFTKAHAERTTKDYDSRPGINGEVERLRIEIERLRGLVRDAYLQGYWRWAGPANEVEFAEAEKGEQEGWEEWAAANGYEQSGD